MTSQSGLVYNYKAQFCQFICWEKSQTIQFHCFPTVRKSGVVEDKSGKLGVLLFAQCVPDFCSGQSFPTYENQNFYCWGHPRKFQLITNPLNCFTPFPPPPSPQIKMASVIDERLKSETDIWQFPDFSANYGQSRNREIPNHLEFSCHMITRLKTISDVMVERQN